MKHTPLLRRTPMPRATKPLAARSAKRRAHYASDEGRAGLAHMARVRALPCVVCFTEGLPQISATTVHHCIHGRYSTRKAPDTKVLPLCDGHHQGDFDKSKVALHRQPDEWKRLYGLDTDWIAVVADMLAGELTGPRGQQKE